MRVVVLGDVAHVIIDAPGCVDELVVRHLGEHLVQVALDVVRGSGSCTFQTTIGTKQISQSAIQQTSSSKYRLVRTAASQSSQVSLT